MRSFRIILIVPTCHRVQCLRKCNVLRYENSVYGRNCKINDVINCEKFNIIIPTNICTGVYDRTFSRTRLTLYVTQYWVLHRSDDFY